MSEKKRDKKKKMTTTMIENIDEYEYLLNTIQCSYDDSNRRSESGMVALIELSSMSVIQKQDDRGDYLLHIALRDSKDYDSVILKLLELFPIAVQHQNNDGCLPLHIACYMKASENVVMTLIEAFPEAASIKCIYERRKCIYIYPNDEIVFLNSFCKGCYALHLACMFIPSDTVIRELMKINPMILQERNNDGDYPMHCVGVCTQSTEISQFVFDADPLSIQRQNNIGDSVLHLAFPYVPINAEHIPFLEHMVKKSTKVQINLRNFKGYAPIHVACLHKCYKGIEILLKHPDINPNVTNNCNETPLQAACIGINRCYTSVSDIFKNLLCHPFIIIDIKNNNNKTPLDLVQEQIKILEGIYVHHEDNDHSNIYDKRHLQECLAAKELLEEFNVRRRFHSFCYHLNHVKET